MLGNNFHINKENVQKTISITFVGEPGSGKSVLRESLSNPIIKKTSPLQFSYFSTESYKVLAFEVGGTGNLLELSLKKDELDNAIAVIAIDLSNPQNVVKSLLSWIGKLKSVTKVDTNASKSQVSWFNYSLYMDCDGLPRETRLNSNFNSSLIGPASSLNFGLKMVVVGTRSETTGGLDSEEVDFMHQSLRAICLLFGMPLLYISEEIPCTITRFREYIIHYSFSQIYSSALHVRSDDYGFPSPPEYLEREKTFIPAGWDTRELIESFSDQNKYIVSEYFTRSESIFDWVEESYTKVFPLGIISKPEFLAMDEQDFLAEFSNLNVSENTVEEEEVPRMPLKINNLPASGSSQNEMLSDRMLFAVPKKGRLYEAVVTLLHGADISFVKKQRLDIANVSNFPIAIVFLPAADIPKFVAEGNVDIGITGQDMISEAGVDVESLLELEFGKCNLCIQVPIDGEISSVDQLIGKRIVTSFECITQNFFRKLEGLQNSDLPLKTHISYVSGSVETACALGLADGIVDLVESGETMRAAKLTALANIMPSQAVLICNRRKWESNPLIDTIKNRIKGVIAAQKYVLISYNIQRSSMQNAFKITPGKKAPTVSPLERDDWVSISAMVLKKACAEIMDQLTGLGAEDILVFSINNCRVD